MLKRLLCAAAVVVCFSSQAQAKTDGNKVMQLCATPQPCDIYLTGLVSGLLPLAQAAKCLPSGVSLGQATDVLLKYLKSNPSKRHLHIALIFDDAMKEAFNCQMVFFRGWLANEEYAKTKPAPK